MPNLVSMARACNKKAIAGVRSVLYITLIDELTGWPQTAAELGGSDPGDTKILGEAFDFTGAPAGKGYWRTFPILVDTGAVNNESAGEVGSLIINNRLPFFILGSEAEQLEAIDCFVQYSGCMIAMIAGKNKKYYVMGNPDDPVWVQEITGGTGTAPGDRNGHQYTLYSNTGESVMIYDDSLGIDIEANV